MILKSNKNNNKSSIINNKLKMLYTCRETSTNHPFLCKTNPIFPGFSPKNNDSTKKQTQFKAKANPNQNLSSIGAYLLFCRGANNEPKIRRAKPKQTQPALSSVEGSNPKIYLEQNSMRKHTGSKQYSLDYSGILNIKSDKLRLFLLMAGLNIKS
jgi:hypothetical protein